ncbi:metallophosphoesterase family protein [Adhaeribacter pallidiroseus]|uniref:Calcineurin-like phosphoesterase domain-containing protein n=1 Tax=Adhaeribacter pallidiroseus TaxID=2072847 RepID=A0A369QM56_9BACT|nr:metallophosphoesterase [Adhaeribacter pallidiroseus]RDC63919.1 hypothetical protein AHMF7616_02528 [Adhaeribacter pallidiroseus]
MSRLISYWRRIFLLSFCCLLLTSCDYFDFSPYQVNLKEEQRNLNKKNLDRIAALKLQPEDTLRFALISDNQRFYDELEDVVKAINTYSDQVNPISFAFNCGDLTDFGLQEEYVWQLNRTQKLKMPYLPVIGNHDCVANGVKIYEAMYGPMDFSFVVAGNKFIFLNTNALEFDYPVPDMNYLREAISGNSEYQNTFVISHVPPFDTDFDKNLTPEYAQIIHSNKVTYSIHGHQHSFRYGQPFNDGQNYLVVDTIQNRSFIVVTVIGKQVSFERIKF